MRFALIFSSVFVSLFISLQSAQADRLEEARVIRIDSYNNDTIVERLDGSHWLLQHSRTCTSLSTEWPVKLLIDKKEKITKLKVNFNELCAVYTAGPMEDEVKVIKLIRSDNALKPDHQMVLRDGNEEFLIDYPKECKYVREFLDKMVYVYRGGKYLEAGKSILYLPGDRGSCKVERVEALGGKPDEVELNQPILKLGEIQQQARNNEVYFYWEPLPQEQILYYAYGHSRHQVDPKEFNNNLTQLPNFGKTKENQATIGKLANGKSYYFFFAPVDKNRQPGAWTTLEVTPVNTAPPPVNRPDLPEFEIQIAEETDAAFLLTWPAMENVKKYRVIFSVDGKRRFMKDLSPNENKITIEKSRFYEGKGLTVTVRTLKLVLTGMSYSDGHYWVYDPKKKGND